MMDESWADILGRTLGMNERNARDKTVGWWLDSDKHRNHYCVNPDDANVTGTLEAMTEAGLLKRGVRVNLGRYRYYHATEKGIVMALMEFATHEKGVAP